MMTDFKYKPMYAIWGGIPVRAMENDIFYAAIFKDSNVIRMDIVRKDFKDGITWDEMRQIKNDCGYADMDAVEFFPSERDVINTGNVRHLFVCSEKLPLIRRNFHG